MIFAFIVNNYPPRTGGVEMHVQALAQKLSAQGHKVTVLTLSETPEIRYDDKVKIVSFKEHLRIAGILGFGGPGIKNRIAKILKNEKTQIVSVHTRFFPFSYIGVRAAKKLKLPVIHTEHGSSHVVSDSPIIAVASRLVDYTLGRYVLKTSNTVLAVSREVAAFVKKLSGRKSTVFMNAINYPTVESVAAQNSPARPKHLVFVGRIVPGKGWQEFLQIVASLNATDPDISGEILGDGADMPQLRKEIARLQLEKTVRVRGRVGSDEVINSLAGATLINPTTLAEGFQTTLLEAIAAGARIATYPVPGAADLKKAGAAVHIAENKSVAALKQATVVALDDRHTDTCDEVIQAWSWDKRAAEYTEIAQSLIVTSKSG